MQQYTIINLGPILSVDLAVRRKRTLADFTSFTRLHTAIIPRADYSDLG